MKIASHVVVWALVSLPVAHSWSMFQTPFAAKTSATSSTTRLYISSWGQSGSPYAGGGVKERSSGDVQSYLPEPSAVEARSNVDGNILVSGIANSRERTDQFLLDLLNDEDSAFEFSKITCLVPNAKFSKKRLLSRSARYTGLLDKLAFIESPDSNLPTAAQLEGVKSWIAVIEENHLESMKQVAAVTAEVGSSLENVAILLIGANELDAAASKQVLDDGFPHAFNPVKAAEGDAAEADADADADAVAEPVAEPVIPSTCFTVVAVGAMDEETLEGRCYYQYKEFGSDDGVIPADSTFPRQESYRVVTELMQLACGRQQALSFARIYNTNVTEARLIKGLREAGYARPQEIDHMIREGPAKYQKYVDEWKKENPDAAAGYTTDAWWEGEIYQNSRKKSAARDAEKEQVVVDEKTKQVETIAKEWVKREYFRQSMAGSVSGDTTTEEEFTKQVWERALFEANLKYRQMNGEEDLDTEAEMADFKTRQERKKQTMLKRAKEDLAELLDEDIEDLLPPESSDRDDGGIPIED
eukprot:CAMPEP_0198140352 /NCGR_PEP_ID=MMETSP1443-20131203/3525_1 /TAXON_ID=186043 /ORGANISM="Entomoneis sp., Strain CCMP2396" /LENGTH=528 /DNA_ID=CAMNT_0043802745 /DNA_START=86 /DNA_END=1672 /DNA_ORIENTATION=-